jgi:hypothetical protein
MAHFIDTTTFEIVQNTLVDQRPRFAPYTLRRILLYVSAEIGGTVSVIDPSSGEVLTRSPSRYRDPARDSCNGRSARHAGRQPRLRGAWPIEPGRRGRWGDLGVLDYLLVRQRVWQLALRRTKVPDLDNGNPTTCRSSM